MIRRKREPLPSMFEPLALYNAERARGIVHTPEWKQRMDELQRHFGQWAGRELVNHEDRPLPPLPSRPIIHQKRQP